MACKQLRQALERGAGVALERKARVLGRVELGDVDVDERDVRIAECCLRGGREADSAGADANHDVRVGGDAVRGERSGRADRAEV